MKRVANQAMACGNVPFTVRNAPFQGVTPKLGRRRLELDVQPHPERARLAGCTVTPAGLVAAAGETR